MRRRLNPHRNPGKVLKLLLGLAFISFLATWIVLYHFTGLSEYLSGDKIRITIGVVRESVARFGILGEIFFILVGSLAFTTNVHTVIILFFSIMTFGKVSGFIICTIIICIGMTLVYYTAQPLSRRFLKRLFEPKLKKLESRFIENELIRVVYLRLIFFMSPVLNWLLSIRNISYKNYFIGTLLGAAPGFILCAWLSNTVIELILAGKSLNPIRDPRLLIPASMGVTFLLTMRIIDHYKRKKRKLTDSETPQSEQNQC